MTSSSQSLTQYNTALLARLQLPASQRTDAQLAQLISLAEIAGPGCASVILPIGGHPIQLGLVMAAILFENPSLANWAESRGLGVPQEEMDALLKGFLEAVWNARLRSNRTTAGQADRQQLEYIEDLFVQALRSLEQAGYLDTQAKVDFQGDVAQLAIAFQGTVEQALAWASPRVAAAIEQQRLDSATAKAQAGHMARAYRL